MVYDVIMTDNYVRIYGIKRSQVDEIRSAQNEACAICKRRLPLVVDHCHDTGRVRGLLCQWCNRGMGMLGDNRDYLQSAISYLSRSPIVIDNTCSDWCPGVTDLTELYKLDKTLDVISTKYNVSPMDVWHELEVHNIPRTSKVHICGLKNMCPGGPFLQKNVKTRTFNQIAIENGVKVTTVAAWMRIHKINYDPNRKGRHECGRNNNCPGKDKLQELASGGYTRVEIAQFLNIPFGSLGNVMSSHSVHIDRVGRAPRHTCGKGNKCPGKDVIDSLRQEGKTYKQIASIFGAHVDLLYKWGKRHQAPLQTINGVSFYS